MRPEPTKPDPQPVAIGAVYLYQGRRKDFSGKQVKVRNLDHPYGAELVDVVVLKGKGQEETATTFGCDTRWLTPPGGKAPFTVYDNALRQYLKGQPQAKAEPLIGLDDPEQFDQGIIWDE